MQQLGLFGFYVLGAQSSIFLLYNRIETYKKGEKGERFRRTRIIGYTSEELNGQTTLFRSNTHTEKRKAEQVNQSKMHTIKVPPQALLLEPTALVM